MRKATLFLIILILFLSSSAFPQSEKQASSEQEQRLIAYLNSHRKSPEDYVVEKFSDHDVVFIGEMHRVKHDVELIHNLIPRLYKAGVYNLGIEFGRYEDQDKVDRLITADKYDEDLARWLQFKQFVAWGYKEYEDIYRKAWELNKSLPKGAPRFRVVALAYKVDWTQLQENMTDAQWKKVWFNGEPDEQMAQVVLKEFVEKGKKALIYSGAHHAFTRYRQPDYDYQNKKLNGFREPRMGNIVYAKIGKKAFNIFLHSPWPAGTKYEDFVYPVGGIIDRVMTQFPDKRVGFDVVGSPFGALREDNSYYIFGYPNFALSTLCDGYIFQKQIEDYEGVTVDETFITKENLQEAIDHSPNFGWRKSITKPEDMLNGMRDDANIQRRFKLRLVGPPGAQPSAADVTGTWNAKIETPNGSFENTFVFKIEGTKLTGSVRSGPHEASRWNPPLTSGPTPRGIVNLLHQPLGSGRTEEALLYWRSKP